MARPRLRMLIASSRPDRGHRVGSEGELATTSADPLEALYRDHSLHIFRYLRARVESDDDAAELTAVTFERAIRSHDRFRTRGAGERAWLIRIARNVAIDAARARRRTVVDHARAAEAMSLSMPVERQAELRVLVAALPEEQRDALHLRYAGGLTAKEIGAVIGKSEAAAQKVITRALSALREAYRDGT